VIPKGTTHEFWKAIRAGADRAGAELGVEVLWKGPLKENDRAAQIQVVQQFVNQKVAGIALAPLDLRALVQPVAAAKDAGIPVVIYDSGLEGAPGKDFVSYVATDNVKGGRLGGEELARLVGPSGKVVLLRYQVGSASTMEREQGFLEVVQRQAGIQILSDNRYAGASAGEAKTQALNMLDVLKAADGVFCSNESATNGMLLALRQEGLAGKIKFVGFDASPPLVEALRNGEIHALVLQDPRDMGHRAVTTLVRHLRGEPVDAKIDTALAVATRANMDDPAIQPLLH
jgi:ribose transport system substrate-binding protein